MRFLILLLVLGGLGYYGMNNGEEHLEDIKCYFHEKSNFMMDDSIVTRGKCKLRQLK